jgi:hypothetical protein
MKQKKRNKTAKKNSDSDISELLKQIVVETILKEKPQAKPKRAKKPKAIKVKTAEPKDKKAQDKGNSISYRSQAKLDYQRSLMYSRAEALSYEKLFDYMGKPYVNPYRSFVESFKESRPQYSEGLTEEELERIIKREQINIMLRNSTDQMNIDEKEKYKYWKTCNMFMNMLKIELLRVGEGATGVMYV